MKIFFNRFTPMIAISIIFNKCILTYSKNLIKRIRSSFVLQKAREQLDWTVAHSRVLIELKGPSERTELEQEEWLPASGAIAVAASPGGLSRCKVTWVYAFTPSETDRYEGGNAIRREGKFGSNVRATKK